MDLLGVWCGDAAPANVQSGARQRWPELVHLIPTLAPDEREKLTADYTQLRLFRGTSSFIREQAEAKPLVMLFDDLHWADTTTRAAASTGGAFGRRVCPVGVAGGQRRGARCRTG
jgi:hypothetical protein